MESGRLCLTIEDIREHFYSVTADKGNNSIHCEVCGIKTIWRCGLCKKAMCTRKKKGWNGGKCIFQYHNHDFFGLSRTDHEKLVGKDLRTWEAPNDHVISKNARKIKRWKREVEGDGDNDDNNWLGVVISVTMSML